MAHDGDAARRYHGFEGWLPLQLSTYRPPADQPPPPTSGGSAGGAGAMGGMGGGARAKADDRQARAKDKVLRHALREQARAVFVSFRSSLLRAGRV